MNAMLIDVTSFILSFLVTLLVLQSFTVEPGQQRPARSKPQAYRPRR
jgi:hypothetical protein